MRPYEMGNPELDTKIRDLVDAAGGGDNPELIHELIVTALKLARDRAQRGDLKLLNSALKEMRYSMLVFSRHQDEPKVTLFGSARLPATDPNYQLAYRFGELITQKGWDIITGAGPGIMEAGSTAAGRENSFGVSIRLPFEPAASGSIAPERLINFKYFFTRKLGFVKESHAFVLMPGGFGTLDETFELLTLVQTGKSDLHPIVMLEAEGTGFWEAWDELIRTRLAGRGMIAEQDLNLYRIIHNADEAVDEVIRFYANYHSQRYVGGRLVLRLAEAPNEEQLGRLNEEFADIVVEGEIEVVEPTDKEIEDNDVIDRARIAFVFDRRSYGRLRQLIDALNDLVEQPEEPIHPPPAFGEEQAERPW